MIYLPAKDPVISPEALISDLAIELGRWTEDAIRRPIFYTGSVSLAYNCREEIALLLLDYLTALAGAFHGILS